MEDSYSDTYHIEFFAYDWRLSNQISAEKLDAFIEENNYTDVVLVCHSMGGLVASGYLAMGESQQNKTETVIMLGAPLLGTPVMPYAWFTEDIESIGFDTSIPDWVYIGLTALFDPVAFIAGNFRSMYELFPTEQYMDENYADQTYLYNESDDLTTYEQTQDLFEGFWSHYNATLAASAKTFHDSLYYGDSNVHVTCRTNTFYIAGFEIQTINKLTFNCDYFWDSDLNGNLYYRQYTWCETEKIQEGDSMVPVCSATLGDKYSNRTFFVSKVSHASLVEESQVLLLINRLIVGNTSLSALNKIEEELS